MPEHEASLTAYPEVNTALHALLAGARSVLGDPFVGLYVHGSLAGGGFEPGRSDVDFCVATSGPLPAELLPALEAMHVRLAASGLPWVDRLEGSYIPVQALRRYDPADAHHPALRVDGTFDVDHHGVDWTIQLHVLREHGITLAGPSPTTLIDPIEADDLRRATIGILHAWWVPKLDDPSLLRSAEYQAYAILTMCRILYTIEHGTVVSKATAARWARTTLDGGWGPLIEEALAWRHGMALYTLEEVQNLIRYTVQRAERYSG
ncbi:MAG: DUF4111 domain-containing protein [Anaerolineae bacterium]|nr:DUF4111 domain-containing protein [Anaerolineae bacterium]